MKFYVNSSHPSTMTQEMKEALSVIQEALNTPEQQKAFLFLERELQLAMAYITELQWDAKEAASLIRQSFFDPVFPQKYLKEWALDCYGRLDSHEHRTLECMKEMDKQL